MIPGSANPLLLKSAAAAGGYQVSRSLRFNSSDSGFLSRTPAVAGSRTTWTWAGWVKRSKFSGLRSTLFRVNYNGAIPETAISFTESAQVNVEALMFATYPSEILLMTQAVFRDTSAWYHIVCTLDTTNGTSTDRARMYVNGTRVTTFAGSTLYPSSSYQGGINSTDTHRIGGTGNANEYFDGYLADVHFIDGQALTPSSFTEVSATTGQLIPKAYTGTYTGNSFWLKFNDNSAATATTLGKDSFLLGNNWTPNNLSVTAGAGNDSLVDTPTSFGTDTGVGGEVRGNYATFNPLNKHNASDALSNGNLDLVAAGGSAGLAPSTIGVSSGKWYCEFVFTGGTANDLLAGIRRADSRNYDNSYLYRGNSNLVTNGSVGSNYGSGFVLNDVVGVAFDADNGKLFISVNGTFTGSGNPVTGANPAFSSITGTYNLIVGTYNNICNATVNFGQRAFAHPVSGFKALCDTNLGAPLVAKPNTVMDVLTWSGNNASPRTFSGLNFSPDFVWIKCRSDAAGHSLYDANRGVGKLLESNITAAEITNSQFGYLSAFNSDGFTALTGTYPGFEFGAINMTGRTYVGWAWDAGTSTVSNTAGSITSQVRANASAGFSVVTWTGDGAAEKTVGHGLGVAPKFYIVKRRNSTSDWVSFLTNMISGFNPQPYINLNGTAAAALASQPLPTSNVFYVQSVFDNINTGTYVAYCFAPVVGYSAMGSYTGNGSTDGPFVYTGFRPRWVLIKSTSTTGWAILDAARNTYNLANSQLFPHASDAELTSPDYFTADFLSNGFKLRTTNSASNANGQAYIYAAFAEHPFAYARAR